MKAVIIMAGAGASGKTTTTKAFAIGNPVEYKVKLPAPLRHGVEVVPIDWTLCDNCGITGNFRSGTDSNTGPGLVEISFEKVMKERDVVIVDGMVSSPRWASMVTKWQDSHPEEDVVVILLHFDLPPEEVLARLARRRGVKPSEIRQKMLPKCESLDRRAKLLVQHVHDLWTGDIYELKVLPEDSTDDIVAALDDTLCEIFGDCYEVDTL